MRQVILGTGFLSQDPLHLMLVHGLSPQVLCGRPLTWSTSKGSSFTIATSRQLSFG